jgi:hypothetical protein
MGQLATTQFRIFDEARVAFVSSSLQYFKWLVKCSGAMLESGLSTGKLQGGPVVVDGTDFVVDEACGES